MKPRRAVEMDLTVNTDVNTLHYASRPKDVSFRVTYIWCSKIHGFIATQKSQQQHNHLQYSVDKESETTVLKCG